jgi:hypothetical protein
LPRLITEGKKWCLTTLEGNSKRLWTGCLTFKKDGLAAEKNCASRFFVIPKLSERVSEPLLAHVHPEMME